VSYWPAADEHRHEGSPVEAWWFWGRDDDALTGLFVGVELRGDRFDYWAGLVRAGRPYLYVDELDGRALRRGLEIKPPQMWADHVCDVPFEQWSLGNEAHGVLLDDPTEAWRRAHGDLVPVTFDVEWHATAAPEPRTDADAPGYRQAGEIDAVVQLLEGSLHLQGPAERVHVWDRPYLPSSFAMPVAAPGLRAPYRRSDGGRVDQVLSPTGWWVRA
jgi:hypothetical protein